MKYEQLEKYRDTKFRRITGIKRITFKKMLRVLAVAEACRRAKGGPKPKLSLENMLMAALEYWREYRTYAHIAVGFELSESQLFRTVRWVEDVLITAGNFSLPGKKSLLKSDAEYEVLLIDATETPVERPKRGKNSGIPERKSGTP
jgi:hypothetical protein